MPSYAISGASQGIGREMVLQLAQDVNNTVFAIVRDPQAATKIQEYATTHKNVHLVKGDVKDPQSLVDAAAKVGELNNGKLDVLIHNANAIDTNTFPLSASQMPMDVEGLKAAFDLPIFTSVYGPIWLTNAFLPLIEKGDEKKLVYLTTAASEIDFVNTTGIKYALPYTVMKAALNLLVAKYNVELRDKCIKTLAISPGFVDTWEGPASEKPDPIVWVHNDMTEMFKKYNPDLKGLTPVQESVKSSLSTIKRLDSKMSGLFLSHEGNKNWM